MKNDGATPPFPMARRRAWPIAVSFFLAVLAAGGFVLSVRSAVDIFASKDFRRTKTGMAILRGGAAQIGGTPAKPRSDVRKILTWETAQNIPFRIPILEAAAMLERLAGWNVPLLDGTLKTFSASRGFLAFANYRTREARAEDAGRLIRLLAWLRSHDVPVLCVFPPNRLGPGDVLYRGVFDFEAEQDFALAGILVSNGIHVLDLSSLAEREGLDPHSMYYATDLHFHEITAHWAARHIASRLSRIGVRAEFGEDPPVGSEWGNKMDSRPFLGAMGRRASLSWCEPEVMRFPLLRPSGRFSIIHENFRGVVSRAAGGYECLFDRRRIDSSFGLYRRNPYDAFAYGSGKSVDIRNHSMPEAPRLFFVADSFDNEILTFLAPVCSRVTSVDCRNGDVDLESMFDGGAYDAIVVLFYTPPTEKHIAFLCRDHPDK